MADFVQVRGLERVQGDLRWLIEQYPEEVSAEVGAFARRERDKLERRPYPPELPNQQYVRTYRFAEGWRTIEGTQARWVIRNLTPYGGYVSGRETQAAIHQGRWWIAADIVQEDADRELAPALQRLVDRRFA